MKCIDAIEGTAKSILVEFMKIYERDGLDDTEFVRNIKAVLDGVDEFVRQNMEIVEDPQTVNKVLYEFSKTRWLENLQKIRADTAESIRQTQTQEAENDGYDEYYFDYIYSHGMYPR